jgi:hypothetical protein
MSFFCFSCSGQAYLVISRGQRPVGWHDPSVKRLTDY